MHDIEQNIAAWRERVRAALPGEVEAVRELEEHLRDQIAAFRREGMSELDAFVRSVERLGTEAAIAREFRRKALAGVPALRVPLVILVLMGSLIVSVWTMLAWKYHLGRLTLLLAAHVIAITTGYMMVLATGMVGVCALVSQLRRSLAERERRELRRLLSWLTLASGFAVSVGIGLGMFWAAENLGSPWLWSSKEWGALLIMVSTALSLGVQTRAVAGDRVRAGLATFGIVVVPIGWFGTNTVTAFVPIPWLCLAILAGQIAVMKMGAKRSEVHRVV